MSTLAAHSLPLMIFVSIVSGQTGCLLVLLSRRQHVSVELMSFLSDFYFLFFLSVSHFSITAYFLFQSSTSLRPFGSLSLFGFWPKITGLFSLFWLLEDYKNMYLIRKIIVFETMSAEFFLKSLAVQQTLDSHIFNNRYKAALWQSLSGLRCSYKAQTCVGYSFSYSECLRCAAVYSQMTKNLVVYKHLQAT